MTQNRKAEDFRLCYISPRGVVWFTTANLEDQWGDDWDDAPYEHNAGAPYPWDSYRNVPEYELLCVRYDHYDSSMLTPAEVADSNSRYSVRDINAGAVAWLFAYDHDPIRADTTLPNFIRKLADAGGEIYVTMHDADRLKKLLVPA